MLTHVLAMLVVAMSYGSMSLLLSRVCFCMSSPHCFPSPLDSAHMISQTPVRATWSRRSATMLRTTCMARAYVLAYALAESHLTISEQGEA